MAEVVQSATPVRSGVDMYWLPLGAGAHCVRWNGQAYEAVLATRERREPCDLYHAALEVRLDGTRYVVEMAPVWDRHEPDRGVVAEGPVGLGVLGHSRWFRYEVRCWRNGLIPDVAHAVDGARRLSTEPARARAILALIPSFPTATWGRDELRTGDMWNSNSLVSWLLARSGGVTDAATVPVGGRAPGWTAGLVVAARDRSDGTDDADFSGVEHTSRSLAGWPCAGREPLGRRDQSSPGG